LSQDQTLHCKSIVITGIATGDFALFRTLGLLKVLKLPIYISYLTVLSLYPRLLQKCSNLALVLLVLFM
ncbi:hypothetical protein, partial [Bacteroides intestinalis]|uniref:hypothetical protein n=1 Tax=Bacteroides intestinalis TaxID=329854 RepID=UPI0022E41D3A